MTKKELEKRIRVLENSFSDLEGRTEETISCEKCGCLVRKSDAVKGKAVIKQRRVFKSYYSVFLTDEDYIYTPYYCKVHAPKEPVKK